MINFVGFLQELPDMTNLVAVLVWLTGAGGVWVAGEVASYLAENWVTWHTLPTWVRKFAPIVAAIVISVLAKVLLDFGAAIEAFAPWYSLVIYSILTYLATQKAHVAQVSVDYGASAKLAANKRMKVDEKDSPIA